MAIEYKFDNEHINNLAVVSTKVYRKIGVWPISLSDSNETTIITFEKELSENQFNALKELLNEKDLDEIPKNEENTNFIFKDIELIKNLISLDFDVFYKDSEAIIQFTKKLTDDEKNIFRQAFMQIIIEI